MAKDRDTRVKITVDADTKGASAGLKKLADDSKRTKAEADRLNKQAQAERRLVDQDRERRAGMGAGVLGGGGLGSALAERLGASERGQALLGKLAPVAASLGLVAAASVTVAAVLKSTTGYLKAFGDGAYTAAEKQRNFIDSLPVIGGIAQDYRFAVRNLTDPQAYDRMLRQNEELGLTPGRVAAQTGGAVRTADARRQADQTGIRSQVAREFASDLAANIPLLRRLVGNDALDADRAQAEVGVQRGEAGVTEGRRGVDLAWRERQRVEIEAEQLRRERGDAAGRLDRLREATDPDPDRVLKRVTELREKDLRLTEALQRVEAARRRELEAELNANQKSLELRKAEQQLAQVEVNRLKAIEGTAAKFGSMRILDRVTTRNVAEEFNKNGVRNLTDEQVQQLQSDPLFSGRVEADLIKRGERDENYRAYVRAAGVEAPQDVRSARQRAQTDLTVKVETDAAEVAQRVKSVVEGFAKDLSVIVKTQVDQAIAQAKADLVVQRVQATATGR